MTYYGKAKFGQIPRSFASHAVRYLFKRPKNLTQIGFYPRAPSLDAAHQFTLPSLRSVKPDRLLGGMLSGGNLASKRDNLNQLMFTLLIDPYSLPNYSVVMDSLEQTDKDLQRLEKQLRNLLGQISKLREENQSLHTRQEALVTERASLVAKNDEARTKVEAMINRLKGLEQA